jgi:hypothetical protein
MVKRKKRRVFKVKMSLMQNNQKKSLIKVEIDLHLQAIKLRMLLNFHKISSTLSQLEMSKESIQLLMIK